MKGRYGGLSRSKRGFTQHYGGSKEDLNFDSGSDQYPIQINVNHGRDLWTSSSDLAMEIQKSQSGPICWKTRIITIDHRPPNNNKHLTYLGPYSCS